MKLKQITLVGLLALGILTGCKTSNPHDSVLIRGETAYLNSWGPPYVLLRLPYGYKIEGHKGPDFDVYYVSTKKKPTATLGIYLGEHPQQRDMTGSDTEETKAAILGKSVVWLHSKQDVPGGKPFFHQAVYVPRVFSSSPIESEHGIVAHMFIGGENQEEIQRLQKMAEGIVVTNEKGNSQSAPRE